MIMITICIDWVKPSNIFHDAKCDSNILTNNDIWLKITFTSFSQRKTHSVIHWLVFLCKWICLLHVLSFMTTTGYEIGTCTFMVLLLGTYIFEVSQSFFELPQSHVCWCSPIVSLQHCKLLLITYCILYEHVYKPHACKRETHTPRIYYL